MPMTDPVLPVPGRAAAASAPPAPGARATTRGGEDFETFLRMLTVQIRNQDPLNPMQATEFAQQLATFSGVEQQVRTNALLETLLGRAEMAEMAGWIGAQVRSAAGAGFDGARPVELFLTPPAEAVDRAVLVVRDAMGMQVASDAVDPGATVHLWRGLGADGQPLPPGHYSFEMTGFRDGLPEPMPPPEAYAWVREVQRTPDGVMLLLGGGGSLPAAQVSALRSGDG